MQSEIRIRQIKIALPLSVVGLVLGGIGLSVSTHDPEWLKRSGAAIAAVAAGAILIQIRTELTIEAKRKSLDEENARAESVDRTMPIGALEAKLAMRRIELKQAGLTTMRLVVAGYVVTCAMIGELLHGFGDLLICSLLSICASH